jgi:uncharacterized membrane protein
MEAEQKGHPNRFGIYVAAIYLLIVLGVYAITEYNTKPDNVGYDWIPFELLALPWPAISVRLLIPGFILNAGILYLLGTLLEKLWRRHPSK